jgi:glycosyltransferase involved in cell wall biosynthesis
MPIARTTFLGPICHVTDSGDPGGAERVILLLAGALRDLGVEQEIVVMNEGWLYDEARRLGWRVTLLPSKGRFDVGWILSFRDHLRESSIRVVHTHLIDAGFYGCLGARAARVPSVVTEHGDAAMDAKKGFKFWVKLAIAQALAGRVVPVSAASAASLGRRLRFGGRKMQTIYNGIDTRVLENMPAAAEARVRAGIPADSRVVGTLGALTTVKDHANLLRAHALLPPDVVCLMCGEGPLRQELSILAAELGTAERVVMPGFARDVASVFAALDVFCLPSLSEGLPLVVIEAIAAGKPVVCTAVGGVPEVLSRAGGGRLVPAKDPHALAEALNAALEGRVAPIALPDEFRVGPMAAAYLDVYRAVARV